MRHFPAGSRFQLGVLSAGAIWVVVSAALLTRVGAAQEPGARAIDPIARRAQAILTQRCFKCHGENGVAVKNLFVLDRNRLIAGKMVTPGDTTSPLLRAVESGAMPPGTDRVPAADVEALRNWVIKGAPEWSTDASARRSFITEAEILRVIEQDLIKAPTADRPFLRYYSIAHLYNAGVPDAELDGYRLGLSKLVNSLTWSRTIVRPQEMTPSKTLLRIDLRTLGWTHGEWKSITGAYPYGVRTPNSARIHSMSGSEAPYIRADWFVATASIPPLYHEVLRLPATVLELERGLGVDSARNLDRAMVARAGTRSSGVSRNNRVVERHALFNGAYWKSYDFAGNQGEQNIFADPLDFRADGGEFIFNLPNGMQAYYLADARGLRLDRAPIEIVSNRLSPDEPVVVNGRSCMSCHYAGMKTFKDEIRPMVQAAVAAPFDRPRALALYPPQDTLDKHFLSDSERFRKAVEQTGGKISVDAGSEPINALARKFGAEVSVAQAAAEAGLEVKEFQARIAGQQRLLALGFGQLLIEHGGIKRDTWEQNFPVMVRELGLGTPMVEPAAARKGLQGEYFAGTDFQQFKVSRLDPTIDFTWANDAPDPLVPGDNFSVRWTGRLSPRFTEPYAFHVDADDGVRVWIDNRLIIDRWQAALNAEIEGRASLEAGKLHELRVEFKEITGLARIRLFWSSPSQPKEVLPSSQLFQPRGFVPTSALADVPEAPAPGVEDPARPVLNPANGRYYAYVPAPNGISWSQANSAARARSFSGRRGQLATAPSAAINRFLRQRFAGVLSQPAWLGGYQSRTARGYREPDGGWAWISGEPWSFTGWIGGEPSNLDQGQSEEYLSLQDRGWNDARDVPASARGYLIQF